MSNNKAREVNNPIIKQLLDETTPEELAKIDTEMTNNKQQTAVGWYIIKRDEIEMKIRLKLICANEYEQELIKADKQAKEMEIAGKEMSYADGYAQGYKRALEMIEWYIKNYISGMPQDHIVDTNKKVDE